MDNTFLILIIFLIAAVNILAIIIGIRAIVKIKLDKQKISEQITKEISAALLNIQQREIKEKDLKEESKPVIEENKPVNKEENQNKFLKYTSKGYINPKDDSELKQYTWR